MALHTILGQMSESPLSLKGQGAKQGILRRGGQLSCDSTYRPAIHAPLGENL